MSAEPARRTRRAAAAIVAAVLAATAAVAGDRPLWGDLESGPHAVGFDVLWLRDASRAFGPGEGGEPAPARPVRVFLWYPAVPGTGEPMVRGDYVDVEPADPAETGWNRRLMALDRHTARNLVASLTSGDPAAALDRLRRTPTPARRGAAPAGGRFPLVLYALGLNDVQQENTVLAEWLASRGYLVATVPQVGPDPLRPARGHGLDDVETQARDLEFAAAALADHPARDRARLATAGFSNGGGVALLIAMRNPEVDAVVGLDSGLQFPWGVSLRRHPQYDPSLRAPVLAIHGTRDPRPDDPDGPSLLDDLVLADRYRLELRDALHLDFTDLPAIHAARFAGEKPPLEVRSPRRARRVHRAVVLAVGTFLDATVGDDDVARERLDGFPDGLDLPDSWIGAWDARPGLAARTAREWVRVALLDGPERAAAAYRASVEADRGARIDPDAIVGWAYSLGAGLREDEARAVLAFGRAIHPRSVAVAAAWADLLRDAGDERGAAEARGEAAGRIDDDPDLDDAGRARWRERLADAREDEGEDGR